MKRDLQKAVQDYRTKYYGADNKHGKGVFYVSDLQQIKEMALARSGDSYPETLYDAIVYGLEAGFMVGFRAAKREKRNI